MSLTDKLWIHYTIYSLTFSVNFGGGIVVDTISIVIKLFTSASNKDCATIVKVTVSPSVAFSRRPICTTISVDKLDPTITISGFSEYSKKSVKLPVDKALAVSPNCALSPPFSNIRVTFVFSPGLNVIYPVSVAPI